MLTSKDEKAAKHPFIHYSLGFFIVMLLQRNATESACYTWPACAGPTMPAGNESMLSYAFIA